MQSFYKLVLRNNKGDSTSMLKATHIILNYYSSTLSTEILMIIQLETNFAVVTI